MTTTLDRSLRIRLTAGPTAISDDATLASAAEAVGAAAIGVIVSGMLRDGTLGVGAIKRAGGRILGQDPSNAAAPAMPSSAIATACRRLRVEPGPDCRRVGRADDGSWCRRPPSGHCAALGDAQSLRMGEHKSYAQVIDSIALIRSRGSKGLTSTR